MKEILRHVKELAAMYSRELSEEAATMWLTALEGTDPAELKAASEVWIRRSRWMPTPADLLGIIAQQKAESLRAANVARRQEQHRISYSEAVRSAFRVPKGRKASEYMTELINSGMSPQEVADRLCGPTDESKEPRYKCPLCLDAGLVRIWHPDAMRAAKDHQLIPRIACVVPCSCTAGTPFMRRRDSGPGFAYSFAPDRMVRLTGDWDRDEEALREHIARIWQVKKDPVLAQFEHHTEEF